MPSLDRFERHADIVGRMAHEFNVPFSNSAFRTIVRYGAIEEDCNHFLDLPGTLDEKKERAALATDMLRNNGQGSSRFYELFPMAVTSSLLELNQMLHKVSQPRQEQFYKDLGVLIDTSLRVHQATDIDKVIELTKLEGVQATQVALDLLPDETVYARRFGNFLTTLNHFARYDNLLNTYETFEEDIKQGKLSCENTRRNRRKIWLAAQAEKLKGMGSATAQLYTYYLGM